MRRFANLIVGGVALLAGGCFSEGITEGLSCQQDEQCGRTQVCDSISKRCVLEENESQSSGSSSESEEDADAGDSCDNEEELRCAPGGVDVQVCTNGVWLPFDCDQVCAENNPPPGKQVGACVEGTSGISCFCADGIGGECVGNEPRTCTEAGLLEFCDSGRFFRLECSTNCADDGYPTPGPCVDDPSQGAPACVCADAVNGSCGLAEQFTEECLTTAVYRKCVDGDWYETSCTAECERRNMSGGECQVNGGVASCVCG